MAKKVMKAAKKAVAKKAAAKVMTSPAMTSVMKKGGKVSMKAGSAAAKTPPQKVTMNKAKMEGGLKGGRI
jgi:hypothetical protein